MTTTPIARYISPADAAGYLGVTTKTIRNLIARGELTGYRLGARAIRIDRRELDELLVPIPTVGGGAR